MVEFPRKAERAYLEEIGIAAVYIATTGHRCIIGASRDLERSWRGLCDARGAVELFAAWWVRDREIAERIAHAVTKHLPEDADAEHAHVEVEAAAIVAGVTLTEHATVMQRATVAADRIREALNVANGGGELAWFNRAYRAYRLQEGGRVINYATARRLLCRAMARRLVLVERLEFGEDMLAEVFGA